VSGDINARLSESLVVSCFRSLPCGVRDGPTSCVAQNATTEKRPVSTGTPGSRSLISGQEKCGSNGSGSRAGNHIDGVVWLVS